MHQVFISYNNADKHLVPELSQALESAGYSTWYYDRDTQIGFQYLDYVGATIVECCAMVLLISPRSVRSTQVDREVVRAYEENKSILPLLCGMNYVEFQKAAPTWRQALAGVAMLELPSEGMARVIPKLLESLEKLGIAPAVKAAQAERAGERRDASAADPRIAGKRIVLAYKRDAQPDEELLRLLESELTRRGASVFIDRRLKPGMEWAREIEKQIRASDIVIPLLSAASIQSEMLGMEVEIAKEAAQSNTGKPYLAPVRVNLEGRLPEPLGAILDPIQYTTWKSAADNERIVEELVTAIENPAPRRAKVDSGDGSGAVPLDSEFYLVRKTDAVFLDAIASQQSIVLIKGPRQMGKTSLLARGLQQARKSGAKVVLTDFQTLNADDLMSAAAFYRSLAELIADKLDIDFVAQNWAPERVSNANLTFQKFMTREVLRKIDRPLVWGLDEVDRLFTCPFATQVFGLIRSWHNERALEPDGPWGRLSMAIVHATEPHLFIQNVNESPFNVGTKIALEDFSCDQVAELNRRYGSPLEGAEPLQSFYELLAGHPFLTRRGLQELRKSGASIDEFAKAAARDDGPFGDHLRRMLVLLAKDAELTGAVRAVLAGASSISRDSFFRLRSAGVLSGDSSGEARMRCGLYADYLRCQML